MSRPARGAAGIPGGTMGMREPGRGGIASRPSGWPVLRTPRWMLAAGAVLVAGLALAAVPHRPSTEQRAADLRGMVHDLTTDIESCAGGVSDSITALRAIQAGTSNDVKTAVNDLVTWGFPLAQRVQTDVASLVTAKAPDAVAHATAQLRKDQLALDAQRARINRLIGAASASLSAHVAPPNLPR